MASFQIFRSDNAMYIERTSYGVRIVDKDYLLYGEYVFEEDQHVYTIDWNNKIIYTSRDAPLIDAIQLILLETKQYEPDRKL